MSELRKYPTEHDRRVYYQDIVYAVCTLLDQYNGNGYVVCGTVEEPSTDVQDTLKRILSLRNTRADDELLERMADCLQWLHNLQNGCSLSPYRDAWSREMERAEKLLAEFKARKERG